MEIHEQKICFLKIEQEIHPKINIFGNFGKISTRIIQYRNRNNHVNVNPDAIVHCFTKKCPRKSIIRINI